MAIADKVADRFTMHDVNLSRFETGEREKIRRMLNGLRDQLSAKLDQHVAEDGMTYSRSRLQNLFKVTDLTIENTYAKIAKTHDDSMMKLAEVSSEKAAELVNRTVGVSLMNVGVPESVLKAMVNDDISLGLPAKEWWKGQSVRLRQRFQNTIRQGVFAGETLSDLRRRVRGRQENGFKDGIMSATTRDADALIRTSVQSIAQSARMETFKANDDVIKGVQWLSTLDMRTSEICMALSGCAWDLEGNVLPDSAADMDFPGPPPVHFQCRSSLLPVVKSYGDLIRDAKGDDALAEKMDKAESKIPKSTQASMDGQVSSNLTYTDWLENQSEETQRHVLGDGKWELWQADEIKLTDLIDQSGRPLTLDELEADTGVAVESNRTPKPAARKGKARNGDDELTTYMEGSTTPVKKGRSA